MLDDLISRATLEDYAGSTVFQRGEDYYSAGAVSRLRATEGRIAAKVEGSETYRVELRDDDGELAYDCTCPHAADGYFCKHCVAVGLAWLSERAPAGRSGGGRKKRRDPWRDIEAFLSTQPPETLVALLLDVAQRDDRLYQSLLLKAERAGAGGGNVAVSFRRAIDDATRIRGFVDWHDTATFAGDIEQVADSLAELLEPATAAALVELAEYAIERIEHALEQIDDSDGEVSDVVFRLGGLHLKACAMARTDPAGLAERLFHFETTLPFGLCDFDIATYRDVLGEQGVRRYRELAQAEWRKFEPRRNDRFDVRRATITRIMEGLAEADGDVEQLVAIKSQDLSSAYCYLGITEIWAKAKQPDKALEWAERGLKAFPGHPDNRLRDFVVAAYLKRKRNDEALQLTWVQFDERPTLEHYVKLHDVAGKLRRWPAQRERALARVMETIAREAATTTRWKRQAPTPDYTLRADIALWEDDLDAAWTAAHQGTCEWGRLIVLAGRLEARRPDDAISLYRRVVPTFVEQTNNGAYDEAIKLIRKVGRLMKAQKQTRQFGDYLAELRAQFKPKRNFIKLLDGVVRTIAVI